MYSLFYLQNQQSVPPRQVSLTSGKDINICTARSNSRSQALCAEGYVTGKSYAMRQWYVDPMLFYAGALT
jgi:hypothetical protein